MEVYFVRLMLLSAGVRSGESDAAHPHLYMGMLRQRHDPGRVMLVQFKQRPRVAASPC
jgi:hypothetical protein